MGSKKPSKRTKDYSGEIKKVLDADLKTIFDTVASEESKLVLLLLQIARNTGKIK